MFAWWASSIGESIRYFTAYYYDAFRNKADDEYYLLVPYINGNDFANGRLIEIVSRTMPVVTYDNCHFWKYLFQKYPERFDWESYNDFNGILINASDQFDPRMTKGCFRDMKLPVISYTLEEEIEARHKLELMGISGEFVCLFVRDGTYLQHQTKNSAYALNDIRDSDISSFESAEDYLAEKGLKTIRMGKVVKGSINLPNCVDYAMEYHSDLMDLWLLEKCKFYVGNLSGIVTLAQIHGVPTVYIGVAEFGKHQSVPYRSDDIYVPKKVYSKKEKRFLFFTEMWDAEVAAKSQIKMAHYYQEQELEFVECSQEEVREAIIEMNEKIDGTYVEDLQEKELQERYHTLLDSWIEKNGYQDFYFWRGNISGSFIRKNAFLLEEHVETGMDDSFINHEKGIIVDG